MNRNPETGDLIVIGNGRHELLVVHAERVVTQGRVPGESTWANVFDAMPTYITGSARHVANTQPKRYKTDGSISVGTKVDLKDIRLIGTCKIKTIVTTQYEITKEKSV
jgi:hypothetical protein